MASERHKLTGWKEIAGHIEQSVRTAQRWERQYGLPIHRPSARNAGAVFAFSDELDGWLSRTQIRERPYVRPVVLLLDPPQPNALSNRKLQLETRKFNVLTAFTVEEVKATLARFDVDAVVVEGELLGEEEEEICAEIKKSYPAVPLILLRSRDQEQDEARERLRTVADHIIEDDGEQDQQLTTLIIQLLGAPLLT
jgi:CheY-like chemotaxis protein